MAVGIFSLLLLIAFLPFKLTQTSMTHGATRAEKMHTVRIEMERLIRDLRAGVDVSLSADATINNVQIFRKVTFTTPGNIEISYYLVELGATEWALKRDQKVGGTSQPGYPKTVIATGLTEFWLRPVPFQGETAYTGGSTYSRETKERFNNGTLLVYAEVYPETARRPLPDTSVTPVEFGSSVTLRNIKESPSP